MANDSNALTEQPHVSVLSRDDDDDDGDGDGDDDDDDEAPRPESDSGQLGFEPPGAMACVARVRQHSLQMAKKLRFPVALLILCVLGMSCLEGHRSLPQYMETACSSVDAASMVNLRLTLWNQMPLQVSSTAVTVRMPPLMTHQRT